jgi:hypothetical protein
MKNELALSLKAAADKYLAWHDKAFSDDPKMVAVGQKDHQDLMSIAGMIENDEGKRSIARAMWRLDTAVRDVIPDKAYYTYTN